MLSQRIRKHYYKTLGTSAINCPMSPTSLIKTGTWICLNDHSSLSKRPMARPRSFGFLSCNNKFIHIIKKKRWAKFKLKILCDLTLWLIIEYFYLSIMILVASNSRYQFLDFLEAFLTPDSAAAISINDFDQLNVKVKTRERKVSLELMNEHQTFSLLTFCLPQHNQNARTNFNSKSFLHRIHSILVCEQGND